MPVFCLFTLGRHGIFTAGVTMEQPYLLCPAVMGSLDFRSTQSKNKQIVQDYPVHIPVTFFFKLPIGLRLE
jgi:hypothetical protein